MGMVSPLQYDMLRSTPISLGATVVYGDTDSVMCKFPVDDATRGLGYDGESSTGEWTVRGR